MHRPLRERGKELMTANIYTIRECDHCGCDVLIVNAHYWPVLCYKCKKNKSLAKRYLVMWQQTNTHREYKDHCKSGKHQCT